MPRIFISHASFDDTAIDALSGWLTAKGYDDHFVDHRDIVGGSSWDAALRREASRAEMLILYVTTHWLASEECFAEYRASFYGDRTVLPLLVEGVRAQDLDPQSRKRFETLCASVQGIPVSALPPEGFTGEQIEAAITRVARAARAARRQRFLAVGGFAAIVLFATVSVLALTNAAYVGDQLAKWEIDRSFATQMEKDGTFFDCDSEAFCPALVRLPAARYGIGDAVHSDPFEDIGSSSRKHLIPLDIPAFAVSTYEVTKAQWRACTVSTRHLDDETARCKELVYSEQVAREPIESISWEDTQVYIGWLNTRVTGTPDGPYRLLSEAEWEYAALGGATPRRTYFWQGGRSKACDYANVLNVNMPVELDVRREPIDCTGATIENDIMLSKVGTYRANDFGLYDTAGNVSEWVADCWHDSHEGRPTSIGAEPWTLNDPRDCDRVLKGGSWIGEVDLLRPAARVGLSPKVLGFNIGMRLARDITP